MILTFHFIRFLFIYLSMKRLLLALLVINTSFLFAQENKWQLGINFSPDYYNIWVKPTKENSWQNAYKDAYKGSMCFSTGLLVDRKLGNRWIFETGITYIEQTEVIKDFYYDYNGSYDVAQWNYSLSSKITTHYLAIPLNALYFLNLGRTKFFIQLGAMPLFYIASKGNYEANYFSGETFKENFNYTADRVRIEFIQGTIGFGLSQQISDNFELRVAPTYRHYFSTNSNRWKISYPTPFAIGLNIGGFMKF